MATNYDEEALLTPSEVAAMFRVNPKTVTRWARSGKISAIRTLGGHRRFKASEIKNFLAQVDEVTWRFDMGRVLYARRPVGAVYFSVRFSN